MKWIEISEVVTGLVLKDKLDPNAVNPMDLFPPYGEIIVLKRDGMDIGDISMKAGYSAVSASMSAIEKVNGDITPLKWLSMLEQSANRAKAAVGLDELKKDLESGKDIDVANLLKLAASIDIGYKELIPMSQVEPQKMKFIRTGWEPLDKHVGGLPYACMTIIGASPGIGKTTLGLKIASKFLRLKENKKKKIAIFSLEMTMGQIHQRYIEINPEGLTDEEKDRILLGDDAYTVHEIYAKASKTAAAHNLGMIVIDFADLLVEGEQTESAMGVIYRNLSMLAKKTTVPVLLISQLNRSTYVGSGIPRINHLRYSGLAEATARLILLPYNPSATVTDFTSKDNTILPPLEDKAYIIVGKSNFGYKEGSPGAFIVEWDGGVGWGDKSFGWLKVNG